MNNYSVYALAALAATASFAQSSVTISGLADLGYRIVNAPGVNKDTQGLAANGIGTTVLTIAGSEDLGGGLKANFQLQLTPDFATGNGVSGAAANQMDGLNASAHSVSGAQQAYVGLAGGFGEVQAGRVNTNALDAWGVGSVFGTALGSGYGGTGGAMFSRSISGAPATIYNTAPTRFNNAIRYISPSFNGFSGSLLYVPKVNKAGGAVAGTQAAGQSDAVSTNREGVTDLGLKYSNGPLNIAYANQKVSQGSEGVAPLVGNVSTSTETAAGLSANGTSQINILSANYNFGATTVYGAYWTEVQKNAGTTKNVDATAYALGAKYVMGSYDFIHFLIFTLSL